MMIASEILHSSPIEESIKTSWLRRNVVGDNNEGVHGMGITFGAKQP
jgi:hypothetical protein